MAWSLPVLLLAAVTPPAEAQYMFRTSTNADGTITINGDVGHVFCERTLVLSIPETIDSRRVTHIGDGAFHGCRGLVSITLPDSVTSIGDLAFSYCTALTNVTFGSGVTSIGDWAFSTCVSLTKVTTPDSVTNIGVGAFYSCYGLGSITIGSGITSIGASAFYFCPLGDQVLFNTSGSMLVWYPRQRVGSYSIPGTVVAIGGSAFESSRLSGVTIPRSVTSIGDQAFEGCTGLSSVTLPDSVISLGDRAFANCIGLTSVTIPDSVTSIGRTAFSGCTSLSAIKVEALNAFYCSVDGILFNQSRTTLIQYPGGIAGSYSIPDRVTSIGGWAFSNCTNLTNLTIPNSVTSIGQAAFMGCSALTSVTIPNSVTNIGVDAFSGCTNLFSITLGDGVTSIGDSAFANCTGLTQVMIPDSVTRLADGLFSQCAGLTSVTIPARVTSIGYEAFKGCRRLTSLTIPDSVTSIGYDAFSSCASLTNACFAGDAPLLVDAQGIPTSRPALFAPATIRHLPGAQGWGPTFSGRPTALWIRPQPTLLNFGDGFGPSTNGFNFIISWATNVPVVVEASADIVGQGWTPISTNTLTDGWVQFTDSEWKSQPARFYRVRGQ